MEKIPLSLKNIYKILMTNDFPIYSESVISEKNRKGQTLLRFWQSQLADEFRSQAVGKMLWRNDGKRNRYVSNLCNRSLEQKLCAEYAGELSQQINTQFLLNQTERFMSFLSVRTYRHDVLLRRISELLRICKIDDNRVPEQLTGNFLRNAKACTENGGPDNLFQAGYLLTILTIYAAAGDAMDEPRLSVLMDEDYSMAQLWKQYQRQETVCVDKVTFLSIHSGILQDNPLPPHRFFGREEELFDLREMAVSNRKCLISGMGGVGKTELLRQLLRLCSEEKLVDTIAVIPYDVGITESFLRAFPTYQANTPENGFRRILRMLEKHIEAGERLLILIDNMNYGADEDPGILELLHLRCSILITSRCRSVSGFETYQMKETPVSTGTLIFRDNYGKALQQEDRDVLSIMLRNPVICHPLSLLLMARAASANSWSVEQLARHLKEDVVELTWTEKDQVQSLSKIYRHLYSQVMLPDKCRELVNLFTILPRNSYSADFLTRVFPSIASEIQEKLEILNQGGWLEMDVQGYSMHPLIAQCLRKKQIPEEKLAPTIATLRSQFPQSMSEQTLPKEYKQLCEILIYCIQWLTGPVSRDLFLDVVKAMGIITLPQQSMDNYKGLLEQLIDRCKDWDDLAEICYYTLLGKWVRCDQTNAERIYRKQKESQTVPRSIFLDFCLHTGGCFLTSEHWEFAGQLLKELLCEDAMPVQIATSYYYLAVHNNYLNKAETALEWCRQGVAYVNAHPECGQYITLCNTFALCIYLLRFRHGDEVAQILKKMQNFQNEQTDPMHKIQYMDILGTYELYFGSAEMALKHFHAQRDMHLDYFGRDRNYYAQNGQIALVLHQLKRYEEAVELSLGVLEYAKETNDIQLLHMINNNLSVFYLDMGQAENALPLLYNILPGAREQGGIALGECLKNLARAYGQLDRTAEEYRCLRESVPLLEAAYGTDHPRPQAARQRLAELEKECETKEEL